MKAINQSIFVLVLMSVAIFQTTCTKEPFTLTDALEAGELEDQNYIQINKDAKVLDDPEIYMEFDSTSVTLSGSMSNYDTLDVGDVITKLNFSGERDFTYFRKIVDIQEENGNTKITTEDISFTQVFDRISISTANRGEEMVVFRGDLYSAGYTFKPKDKVLLNEIKGNIDPDGSLTFSYDTVNSVIELNYDAILGITPRIDMNIKDLEVTASTKTCISGQASLGYKNDKLIVSDWIAPVMAFPMAGLAVYFNPKIEAQVKLKGTICSPEIAVSSGKIDIDAAIYPAAPYLTLPSVAGSGASVDIIQGVTVEGGGSIDVLVGGDLYISNVGPRSSHLVKAGVTVGAYGLIKSKVKGTIFDLEPANEVEVSAGFAGKIFASAELFNVNAFNDALRFGVYWETSVLRLPIYAETFDLTSSCDKNVTAINFTQSNTNLDFRVDCSNCADSKFYLIFNDSTAAQTDGTALEFEYNTDHSIAAQGPYLISNLVWFQDVESTGCIFKADFTDPQFGHDNCNTFTDTRTGDIYCTVQIGGQTWMQENLRYDIGGVGRWYNDDGLSLIGVYGGRLYTFSEIFEGTSPSGGVVQGLCPAGWHVPTAEEFVTLTANSGGATIAGYNLKYPSPSFWATADLPSVGTFNAVASGFYYPWNDNIFYLPGPFGDQSKKTMFWTSSRSTESNGQSYAVGFAIGSNDHVNQDGGTGINYGAVGNYSVIENYGMPCRCIMD